MGFGDERDVQRRLRHMNRRGAVVRYIDDDGWADDFPCERIYVVKVAGDKIALFWIAGCCDFIMYEGNHSGMSSVRYCGMKDIKIVKSVNDKNDGEQWYKVNATRIFYGDGVRKFYEHEIEGKIEISIAFPEYVPKELCDKIQEWKKERAKRHKYYELGERRIVERFVYNHEYILS